MQDLRRDTRARFTNKSLLQIHKLLKKHLKAGGKLECGLDKKVKKKSECGHLAYQIKGKEVWTNIEANTLTLHTPLRG